MWIHDTHSWSLILTGSRTLVAIIEKFVAENRGVEVFEDAFTVQLELCGVPPFDFERERIARRCVNRLHRCKTKPSSLRLSVLRIVNPWQAEYGIERTFFSRYKRSWTEDRRVESVNNDSSLTFILCWREEYRWK